MPIRAGTATALVVSLLLVAPVAMAETDATDRDISDEQLRTFAQARAEVRDVLESYSDERHEAADEEALEEVRLEMQKAMASAVNDTGMSVEQFNELTRLIRRDRDLRKRVADVASEIDAQEPSDNAR